MTWTMDGGEIQFRVAEIGDAKLLFGWKNDEETRHASIDPSEVHWDDHMRWLRAALASCERTIELAFFPDRPNEPVGVVRFDRRGDETELSWTVAPQMRGRGIGKKMVKAAVSRRPGSALIARIKMGHRASEAIAIAAGFVVERSVDGVSYWRKS